MKSIIRDLINVLAQNRKSYEQCSSSTLICAVVRHFGKIISKKDVSEIFQERAHAFLRYFHLITIYFFCFVFIIYYVTQTE